MVQVRVAQVSADHLVVLAEDLTQARRLEAIRRDFVVNVSHELKTPVGALALLAETVQDAADDPEAVRRFAGRMQAEATRLSALVHEIIELSRLQVAGRSGRSGWSTSTPSCRRPSTAPGRPRRPSTSGSTSAGCAARASWPARPAGHGGAQPAGQRGRVLRRGVARRGRGPHGRGPRGDRGGRRRDRHHRGRAGARVRRFYRVDPARSRDTGGTGLGLSIVKHVAADHGGEVTVWSQPGRGSTFTLRLPRAEEEPASTVRELPPTETEGAHVRRSAS